jgi:hypothetical protein
MAYSRAIKAFPKVKVELIIHAEYPELIKEFEAIDLMYRFCLLTRRIIL